MTQPRHRYAASLSSHQPTFTEESLSIFLHLKHWQLFSVLVGVPFVFQMFITEAIFNSNDPSAILPILWIVMIIDVALFLGWLYVMGSNLHSKLPKGVSMNLATFTWFVIIPAAYICLASAFFLGKFVDILHGQQLDPSIFGLIVPVHLFCMFCMFYCLYFVARTLKAVELKRTVAFSDYGGEFFLLWFFPIGVWIIQPRINRMFSNNPEIAVKP